MENYYDEHEHQIQVALGVVAGLLIGGLAGAGTMLLMAPQSGKRTRDQIRRKGVELRDQASDTFDDAVEQAQHTGRHISEGVQKQAGKIQQAGQDILDDQKERWSSVVEAGQKVVQGNGKP